LITTTSTTVTIPSIRDQVAKGVLLSEKQKKTVRQNLYRARMKDKADLFR
jgi:hypothetical protein